jgi:tetratricopeptide (TPR) repeat protein
MLQNFKNSEILRKYLLGQISDESDLRQIEERLFLDKNFFEELEIAEDSLIEDYVNNLLGEDELKDFRQLFLNVPERQEKIRLTGALYQLALEDKEAGEKKKNGFFGVWNVQLRAAFGLLILCVLVGISSWWFVFREKESQNSLANLKSIYKNERPFRSRVAGFEYAPLIVVRGKEKDDKNQIERRKIQSDLERAVDKNPNENTLNALGLFYLTEKRFDEAIAQFEKGSQLNSRNAEIYNNLGAGIYEKAMQENDKEKISRLYDSLDKLNKALETNPNLIEAMFNKALVLRELNQTEAAVAVWKQYLEKDTNSKWSEEARKNLRELESR